MTPCSEELQQDLVVASRVPQRVDINVGNI